MMSSRVEADEEYYNRIKKFNIVHYAGETPYYSVAPLRPA